jgi:hypothetical protein
MARVTQTYYIKWTNSKDTIDDDDDDDDDDEKKN